MATDVVARNIAGVRNNALKPKRSNAYCRSVLATSKMAGDCVAARGFDPAVSRPAVYDFSREFGSSHASAPLSRARQIGQCIMTSGFEIEQQIAELPARLLKAGYIATLFAIPDDLHHVDEFGALSTASNSSITRSSLETRVLLKNLSPSPFWSRRSLNALRVPRRSAFLRSNCRPRPIVTQLSKFLFKSTAAARAASRMRHSSSVG